MKYNKSSFTDMSGQRGFTLLELLVVIAMIGLLATVVLASTNSAREKGKIATAQAQQDEFLKATQLLYADTGKYPADCSILNGCVEWPGPQSVRYFYLDDPTSGLLENPGWSEWNGPYISTIPLDPWGNQYIYANWFYCTNFHMGCVTQDEFVQAILSCGPEAGPSTGVSPNAGCSNEAPLIVKEVQKD